MTSKLVCPFCGGGLKGAVYVYLSPYRRPEFDGVTCTECNASWDKDFEHEE